MHLFMLVFIINGQPERIAATCVTAVVCNQLGADASAAYQAQFHRMPADFSYRVYQVR